MFNLNAATPLVAVDGSGRPREIRRGRERLRVTELESVRDETAAYPVETGPRTVFVVRAGGGRYRLTRLSRDRRWMVEPLTRPAGGLARVA